MPSVCRHSLEGRGFLQVCSTILSSYLWLIFLPIVSPFRLTSHVYFADLLRNELCLATFDVFLLAEALSCSTHYYVTLHAKGQLVMISRIQYFILVLCSISALYYYYYYYYFWFGKVKLFVFTSWKRVGCGGHLHIFFMCARWREAVRLTRITRFIPLERTLSTHRIEGWLGSRFSIRNYGEFIAPARNRTTIPHLPSPERSSLADLTRPFPCSIECESGQ